MLNHKLNLEENERYLIFLLGGDYYCTPLIKVVEVMKLDTLKSMPYMVEHFQGVMKIRNDLVSIIDLRIMFQLPQLGDRLLLLFKRDEEVIGGIVDDIVAISQIEIEHLGDNMTIESKVPLDFVLGIGKYQDKFVTIIDLSRSIRGHLTKKSV